MDPKTAQDLNQGEVLPETHTLTTPTQVSVPEASEDFSGGTPLPAPHEIVEATSVTDNPPVSESEPTTDNSELIYDTIIVGGGPAAVAAGVYAARKEMKTLVITDKLAGQSIVSGSIENWIGEPNISGIDLAKKMENHLMAYSGILTIKQGQKVVDIKSTQCGDGKRACDFELTDDKNETYKSKTVIIASGARRRKLGVPGEDKFEGKGVSFCSTCDAPLFRNKKVAVVGGGNAGFEAVHDLAAVASEIYILDGGPELKADPKIQDEIKEHTNLKEVILNAKVLEVLGEGFVSGIKYSVNGEDLPAGRQEKTLEVDGIFVEIGSVPNSEIVSKLVQLDDHKQIMVNFQYGRTSHPGVFAAGDVTNDPYKQNNISVGDGVRAALSAYFYLHDIEKKSPAAEK